MGIFIYAGIESQNAPRSLREAGSAETPTMTTIKMKRPRLLAIGALGELKTTEKYNVWYNLYIVCARIAYKALTRLVGEVGPQHSTAWVPR